MAFSSEFILPRYMCSLTTVFIPISQEPEHLISNKNKCNGIYLCPCVFFESFRDLNEAKAVNISDYYLIYRFVCRSDYVLITIKFSPILIGLN